MTPQDAQRLYYERRAPEAISIMQNLLTQEPGNPSHLAQLSFYLRAVGKFDESLEALRDVPESMPGWHMLMGWHLMREGKFLDGFRTLEPEIGIYRIGQRYPLPQEKKLQVGESVMGKTILLGLEGGYGDEMAYVRFARALEQQGARVLIGVSNNLVALFARSFPICAVQDIATITPEQFDRFIPAMSAISYFGISNPSEHMRFPYLVADKTLVEKWQPVIAAIAGAKKKIGIHWQGNWEFDRVEMKSPPAAIMLSLAEAGQLFSLQRDAGNNPLPPNSLVYPTEKDLSSWDETAAVVTEMDYIVTNDTSIAHIAGALGTKVLIMLPHAPHHYWLPLQMTSIWYPNMHIFRQPHYNDWEGAVAAAYQWIQTNSSKEKL